MKNINITREHAIEIMLHLINGGYSIPIVGLGNGSSDLYSLDYFSGFTSDFDFDYKAYLDNFFDAKEITFRVVPMSEIAEDFKGIYNLDDFDVCVEFASTHPDNPYREQFLLWDVD